MQVNFQSFLTKMEHIENVLFHSQKPTKYLQRSLNYSQNHGADSAPLHIFCVWTIVVHLSRKDFWNDFVSNIEVLCISF